MGSGLRLLLLCPTAALLACGSSAPANNNSSAIATASGDYVLTVAPQTSNASSMNGDLNITGSTVTGAFLYNNSHTPGCGAQTITFTGTIDSSNVMTLTSSSFAGNVAKFTLQLPLLSNANGASTGSGTAQITGSTCTLASTGLAATFIPTFSGVWSGAVSGVGNGTVSLTVLQGAVNASGQFPSTAVATFASPSCTFSSGNLTGTVSGATLQFSGSNITVSANGGASSMSFNLNAPLFSPGCGGGDYFGTLNRQ